MAPPRTALPPSSAAKRLDGSDPRGTPEKRPMRDTSKPANGIRQDKVVITHGRAPGNKKLHQADQ